MACASLLALGLLTGSDSPLSQTHVEADGPWTVRVELVGIDESAGRFAGIGDVIGPDLHRPSRVTSPTPILMAANTTSTAGSTATLAIAIISTSVDAVGATAGRLYQSSIRAPAYGMCRRTASGR